MTIVIVGGGLAGGTAATELRESGYDGRLVLFASEPHLPYERPPLSKGYLLGKDPLEKAFVHDQTWYDEHDVEVRTGTTITGIDLDRHEVRTKLHAEPYDRLLLATGSTPRRLPHADFIASPMAYLRTIEDSQQLKEAFTEGQRISIVGAGWIGLEVAAAAREAGCDVTVFETASLPLLSVLGSEVAEVFADLHRNHGVDLRLGHAVAPSDLVESDLVVIGIGAAPNDSIADAAGLDVDNGVLVDGQLQTSHPDVLAAGDVANHEHPVLGRRIRVEHWDNAIEQGKTAARNLLGKEEPYDRLPYFFTDQYDLGMEYVGNVGPDGYDRVEIEGDTSSAFRAYWIKNDVIVAGMHANDWDAIDEIKAKVGRRA